MITVLDKSEAILFPTLNFVELMELSEEDDELFVSLLYWSIILSKSSNETPFALSRYLSLSFFAAAFFSLADCEEDDDDDDDDELEELDELDDSAVFATVISLYLR